MPWRCCHLPALRAGAGHADVYHGGDGAGCVGGLVQKAESLETIEKVTTLVFDKTGTALTEGKPKLRVVSAMPPWSETDLLRVGCVG